MKVTLRSRTAGRKNESEKERWLLARIAGPSAGMFSRPSTQGLKVTFSGPPMATFIAPYNNRVPPVNRGSDLNPDARRRVRQVRPVSGPLTVPAGSPARSPTGPSLVHHRHLPPPPPASSPVLHRAKPLVGVRAVAYGEPHPDFHTLLMNRRPNGAGPSWSRAVPPRGRGGRCPPLPRLHRFPQSLRPWAEYLAARGLTVALPLLPGHGTRWEDMRLTGWQDWYAEVDRELRALRDRCAQVFVARAVDGRRAGPAAGRAARGRGRAA